MISPAVGRRQLYHFAAASNHLLLLLAVCCVSLEAAVDRRPSAASYSQLEILKAKQHLRKLRQATVHTIQSPDGDKIDCIIREKQPAFDHPLLKNHTLLEPPSSLPGQENLEKSGAKRSSLYGSQLWHRNGRCPHGTIPVRRPTLQNILHAPLARRHRRFRPFYGISQHSNNTSSLLLGGLRHEYAIGSFESARILGTSAILNVWNPVVTVPTDISISQIWVVAGSIQGGTGLDTMESGWSVEPIEYGDSQTRFFVYWTNDFYNINGCLNLHCPGFMQIENEIALGASLDSSSYNGWQQDLSLSIAKDETTGIWWLKKGGAHIGYWPNHLFQNGLAEAAQRVQWGGEVVNSQPGGQHTDTQMGSGHYPYEGLSKASYARSILHADRTYAMVPFPPTTVNFFVTKPSCYALEQHHMPPHWGMSFFYGGPGRSKDCI